MMSNLNNIFLSMCLDMFLLSHHSPLNFIMFLKKTFKKKYVVNIN